MLAELIPEPSNPHDPNAIRVEIDGRLVGYLSRDNAIKYGQLITGFAASNARPFAQASIVGRWNAELRGDLFGVFLQMPELDDEKKTLRRRRLAREAESKASPE